MNGTWQWRDRGQSVRRGMFAERDRQTPPVQERASARPRASRQGLQCCNAAPPPLRRFLCWLPPPPRGVEGAIAHSDFDPRQLLREIVPVHEAFGAGGLEQIGLLTFARFLPQPGSQRPFVLDAL